MGCSVTMIIRANRGGILCVSGFRVVSTTSYVHPRGLGASIIRRGETILD